MSENEEILNDSRGIDDQNEQECAVFQASLAYRIGAGEDIQQNPHVLTCARCRAFYNDLRTIIDTFMIAFPEVEPSDKIWTNIASQVGPEGDDAVEETEAEEDDVPLPGDLALEGGAA